jgi:hypothetical protein
VSPNAGKTHKRPFEFIFDVFAESDDEAAVGCQKRSRCSDVVTNGVLDLPGRRDKHVELSDLPPGATPSDRLTEGSNTRSLRGKDEKHEPFGGTGPT